MRRQSSLNAARLPVKHLYNIFVTLSEAEGDLYKSALEDYECAKTRDTTLAGGLAIVNLQGILQQGTKIKFVTDLLTVLKVNGFASDHILNGPCYSRPSTKI